MKRKQVFVGHNDFTPLSAEESGIGRPCRARRFRTINQAAKFIGQLPNQTKVARGDYYLDPPENLLS